MLLKGIGLEVLLELNVENIFLASHLSQVSKDTISFVGMLVNLSVICVGRF